MGKGLINRVIKKIFSTKEDEIADHLKEMHNNFLKRIKLYGFENIEEWERGNREYFRFRYQRSTRYPVTSDC